MKYLGGKFRIAKPLAQFINSHIHGHDYYEPFVGACHVLKWIRAKNKFASDIHSDLIEMYKMLQQGWVPPKEVTEEEYHKEHPPHLKAFIGFGCSFGGKWFGGYARSNKQRWYSLEAYNSLIELLPYVKDVDFKHLNYRNLNCKDAVIYCDPPYRNTTGYRDTFCHNTFWHWVRRMRTDNIVLVSEYTAPSDFKCIWDVETKTDLNNEIRLERVFQ